MLVAGTIKLIGMQHLPNVMGRCAKKNGLVVHKKVGPSSPQGSEKLGGDLVDEGQVRH
jgi:hypothetical protein